MFVPVVLALPAILLPLVMPPTRDCQLGRRGDPAADARALAAFELAIHDYASLHRRLDRAWPPAWLVADPEQAALAAEELRAALRAARPLAAPGTLITPALGDLFRLRIADAIRQGRHPEALLPVLPLELEYRFREGDLILLDVHADMILDTLEHALPEPDEDPDVEGPPIPADQEGAVEGCLVD